jgi:alpha-N-arabinofuranosidase
VANSLDPNEPAARAESIQPWVAAANTTASTDATSHPFATNPVSLKVTTDVRGSGMITNPGYWGIDARAGMTYNLSFYAKPTEGVVRATATLRCADGRYAATAVEAPLALDVTRGWAKYSTTLRAHVSCDDASFHLGLVTPKPAQSVNLDGFSLVPGDAVAGLFRKDIFDKIKAMKPGFIRMPGGNYLEGTGPSTYWDWRKSIGPKEARPGHWNSAWGYWVTDGMGLHELLLLCEALGSTAQMSVFTGYYLSGGYSPIGEAPLFATAAVDMIEYAIGDETTQFGQMRVAAGHPRPFDLSRVEVGNEEGHLTGVDGYAAHYRVITAAIWKAYPHMTIVASGRWGGCGDDCIGASPCLTGQRCDAWDDHYYLTPDQMAAGKTMYVAAAPVLSALLTLAQCFVDHETPRCCALFHRYDDYNRSWPDVFVGEFAANIGGHETLQASVAEAMFLLGFEHNGDKVVASSFAPLLRNVHGTQWAYDLINFNSSHLYTLPSYSMQVRRLLTAFFVAIKVVSSGGLRRGVTSDDALPESG